MAVLGLHPGAPKHLAYGADLRTDLLLLETDPSFFDEAQSLR